MIAIIKSDETFAKIQLIFANTCLARAQSRHVLELEPCSYCVLTTYFFLQDGEDQNRVYPMQEVNIYNCFINVFSVAGFIIKHGATVMMLLNSLTENSLRKLYFSLLSSKIKIGTCLVFPL